MASLARESMEEKVKRGTQLLAYLLLSAFCVSQNRTVGETWKSSLHRLSCLSLGSGSGSRQAWLFRVVMSDLRDPVQGIFQASWGPSLVGSRG